MSYAGPVSRNRGASGNAGSIPPGPARSSAAPGAGRGPQSSQPGVEEEQGGGETDWKQLAIFGAGLALGLALGAGAALLAAPQTGEETRAALRSRAKRIKRTTTRRGRTAWSDLGDELRGAAHSLRRRRARRQLRKELSRESAGD